MIKINGHEVNDVVGMTIEEYLKITDYDPKRIAIERNGEIIPKTQYSNTILNDGDSVEIVSFVGGG